MAGQVPQTAPPAYAQQFGNMLQQTGANRADVLGSELKANSDNLGHILGNITKIAEVGGGQFTPDRLLGAYAGSQGDIIDDDYSGMADRLRLAETQANIGRLSRSGGSGGGGKEPKSIEDTGTMRVQDRTGNTFVVDTSRYDEVTLQSLLSDNGWTPVQFGVPLPEESSPTVGNGVTVVQEFADGSKLMSDGTTM